MSVSGKGRRARKVKAFVMKNSCGLNLWTCAESDDACRRQAIHRGIGSWEPHWKVIPIEIRELPQKNRERRK